jgi:hypothetical protein
VFKSGSIQMVTDASIDPAGNVWAANNWNSLEAAAGADPSRPTSTWGGGSGITVINGVAAPVKPLEFRLSLTQKNQLQKRPRLQRP